MKKKKPLVPEKYFGPLPSNRHEKPFAAGMGELVALPPNLPGIIFSSGSMSVLLPVKEEAGCPASVAGVKKPALNINPC